MTMAGTRVRSFLSPVVDLRPGETQTAVLMFAYAFSVMTAYNIVQPVTRSVFITDLGADNVPYVLLAAGVLIGFIMQLYMRAVSKLPERWALPIVQLVMGLVLLTFFLGFRVGDAWVSSGFYMFGQVLGALLLSQFWTLANEVYDPRQARRLFGFIGGGASLGGMAGSGVAAVISGRIGTDGLLLVSAGALVASSGVVAAVLARETDVQRSTQDHRGQPRDSLVETLALVRSSPNLRQLALLISFSAVGAMVIDQQLNLAAEAFRGGDEDAVTGFLASVRFLLSTVALVMQVFLVKQIYRFLGVGFALMMLPVSLAGTSMLILLSGALWAPAVASVVDRSIRYTVDRTTREIFFLPLPSDLKLRVKTLIDVTADRVARGMGAVLVLVAIKPWGLGLSWPQLSILTLLLSAAWLRVASGARAQYVGSIRRGLEAEVVTPGQMRVGVADLTTVETLLEELAYPEERRVLYALEMLESLDKRHLVTPLLLHHDSATVRARAISIIGDRTKLPPHWRAGIQRMVSDPDPGVRSQAILTLAKVENQDARTLARTLVENAETEPRMASSAAVVLAASTDPTDVETAELTLTRLATDLRDTATNTRRDVANALRQIDDPRLRQLLVPLLQDRVPDVAEEAMRSVRWMRPPDVLFVPALVSLLGDRRLKGGARDALVEYGEPILGMLEHVLSDTEEDRWIRRHVPATIARIASQASMNLLVTALDDPDPFLRYKAVAGMEALRRRQPTLEYPKPPLEALLHLETRVYFDCLVLGHDVFERGSMPKQAVLHQVLAEKMEQSLHRTYRLLALLYHWKDIATARLAIEHGAPAARAQAFEYLDNILAANLRPSIMPMLEDAPLQQRVARGHVIRRTHPGTLDDALLGLINHADEVVAAAAIDLVRSEQRWDLKDDVEHVLAHREVNDLLVFGAASWTLASHKLTPEERQARWLEPLPAIVVADRLRGLSMFDSMTVDDICRLASSGRQIRYANQEVLTTEGMVPHAFHILLDGQVTATRRGIGPRTVGSPALVGFEAALAESPAIDTVRSDGRVVTAAVSRDDLLTVLTGNTDLVSGLFRTLTDAGGNTRAHIMPARVARSPVTRAPGDTLTAVEKMLALQRVPTFGRLESVELAQLAGIATEVRLELDAIVADPSDAPMVHVVLSGAISVSGPDADDDLGTAEAGDTVGLFETLARRACSAGAGPMYRLVVARSGNALRLEADDLFDLIGQRPKLLQHLFGTLFDPDTTG